MIASRTERHIRNYGIMTAAEGETLTRTRVLLVGLGGLGGHVADGLARLGVRHLTLVDFDRYETSNLNRQPYATPATVGRRKTEVVTAALNDIDPDLEIGSFDVRAEALDPAVYDAVDLIVDAVDDIGTKCFLEATAKAHRKPLLHGAVGGWYGQVGIVLPGSDLLGELYRDAPAGMERTLGSPTFTPAVVAGMMVSEFVKHVLGRPGALTDRIMMIDLLHHDYRIVAGRPGS